jgi:membrane associated rhomboid family serine protease
VFSRILSHPGVSEIGFNFLTLFILLLFLERNLPLDDVLNLQIVFT